MASARSTIATASSRTRRRESSGLPVRAGGAIVGTFFLMPNLSEQHRAVEQLASLEQVFAEAGAELLEEDYIAIDPYTSL